MTHFPDEDFRCHCGRPCTAAVGPAPALRDTLERLRARYGGPLIISSGNRCPAHNQAVGGVAASEHLAPGGCEAADLACPDGAGRFRLIQAALAVGVRRLGVGHDFLHVGVSTDHPQDIIWVYPGP